MIVYKTRKIEKRHYITEIINDLNLDNQKFFSDRFRIEAAYYNCEELALELILGGTNKGTKFSTNYVVAGHVEIKSFLEDMQVLEKQILQDIDSKAGIRVLKGRSLDVIFDSVTGELYGLCPTLYRRELNVNEFNRLMDKIEQRKNEYEILKINNKLTDEDYVISNELENVLIDPDYNAIDEKDSNLNKEDDDIEDIF